MTAPGRTETTSGQFEWNTWLVCRYTPNEIKTGGGLKEADQWLAIGWGSVMTSLMSHASSEEVERANMTTRIIDVRSSDLVPPDEHTLTPFENIQWMSVLKSLTGYQMYRRAVLEPVRRRDVLEFLFKERLFPRAILHCLGEIEGCAQTLKRNAQVVASIRDVMHTIEEVNPGALSQDELHLLIDEIQIGLAGIDEAMRETYFA